MVLLDIFVYLGIAAAGISGALVGIEKELDLFGVICLCVATALGGGMIRDLMIGNVPPAAFTEPSYFFVSLAAALFTWGFYRKLNRFSQLITVTDAVGLGVFTAVGSNAALLHHADKPFLVVSMGLITGIGGGVMRDVFAKEIPYVFRKEIYAIASILGSLSFILSYEIVPRVVSLYICLLVTFAVRIVSVIYKLNFPVYPTGKSSSSP